MRKDGGKNAALFVFGGLFLLKNAKKFARFKKKC